MLMGFWPAKLTLPCCGHSGHRFIMVWLRQASGIHSRGYDGTGCERVLYSLPVFTYLLFGQQLFFILKHSFQYQFYFKSKITNACGKECKQNKNDRMKLKCLSKSPPQKQLLLIGSCLYFQEIVLHLQRHYSMPCYLLFSLATQKISYILVHTDSFSHCKNLDIFLV